MNYRNDKIKELCRGRRCYIQIPGVCNNDPATVVPAHSPDYNRMHGKDGFNVKAHDIFIAPACLFCHDALDGRLIIKQMTRQDLQWFFDNAHAEFLVDILKSGELEKVL